MKKSRKSLVKAADKAMSRYIIARDMRCVQCGSTTNLTNGHLFSRVAYSTRWDDTACYCQCKNCNLRHEYDPYPFTKVFLDIHGQAWVDDLHSRWSKPLKLKDYQIEEIAKYYTKKAEALS